MIEQVGPVCPKCGAQQPRVVDYCWLCGVEITEAAHHNAVAARTPAADRFAFSLSTLMLVITLASVCFGLLVVAPGLGVPMCVLVAPVLVRTAMVVRRRKAAGRSVSVAQRWALFVSSLGVATVLATVVAVAAFSSFCGVCLLMVSPDQKYGGAGMFLWGVGMCAVAALAVWLTVLSRKWIRRRYRRDVQG